MDDDRDWQYELTCVYGHHIEALEKQIKRLDAEVARLKRGDFTPEEFQALCHHRDENGFGLCTNVEFYNGCHLYQRRLFGQSERDVMLAEINTLKRDLIIAAMRITEQSELLSKRAEVPK